MVCDFSTDKVSSTKAHVLKCAVQDYVMNRGIWVSFVTRGPFLRIFVSKIPKDTCDKKCKCAAQR